MKATSRAEDPVVAAFSARGRCAAALATNSRSAREVLQFVAGLCEAQARVAAALAAEHAARPYQGDPSLDLAPVPAALRDVVTFVAKAGPPALAELARAHARDDDATFVARLRVFWSGERAAAGDYLARALLRPYAEFLRARAIAPQRTLAPGRCRFCGAPPSLSCRRGASESDGAARFLLCSLCGLEWSFDRIVCPSCLEREPTRLPTFSDPARGHVSVEACETCHRYLKSIDVSSDPRRIPEIDELESLALDLWANEQGFTRLEPGLAGL